MDNVRGFGEDRDGEYAAGGPTDIDDGAVGSTSDAAPAVANDERRMHVRAYNHWVSLLAGRAYPSIANLDPAGIADFGAHSVLIDFTGGDDRPTIAYLGRALREECAIDPSIVRIADVPGRSLLSRLTDHYLQIIANRAPVGFEAEFVNTRGHNTMYRGILMPFSSTGDRIDFIYGVINWKELVDAAAQAALDAEVDAALASAPPPAGPVPVWADGPGAVPAVASGDDDAPATLDDKLAAARSSAADAGDADVRSRGALYEALGRAHDFALATADDPAGYRDILADASITVQARAPMTAVARLVFGAVPKARLTEFAAVLDHARREAVPVRTLAAYLTAMQGGMKAAVAAERAARRGERATPAPADPAAALDALPALATLHVPVGTDAGYILLLGRIAGDGVQIVADVTESTALARAMRRAA